MGSGTSCAKVWLILLNSILVICGVLLAAVGGIVGFGLSWFKDQLAKTDGISYDTIINFLPSGELRTLLKSSVASNIGIGLFIVGLVMLFVSLIGCFGACKESRCMLIIYMVAVGILLAAQLSAVIAFWALQDKFLGSLEPELKKSVQKYHSNSSDKKFWDTVQEVFKCCGVTGISDYGAKAPSGTSCTGLRANTGCLKDLKQTLEGSKTLVLAVSCSVMVVQVLVLIAAGVLSRKRDKVDPQDD